MNNEANLLGKLGCPKCNLVLCPAHNSLVCPNCAFKVALSDGVAVVGEKPAPSYFDDKFEVMQKGHHSKSGEFLFCYEKQLQYIEPFLRAPRSSLTSVAALVFPTTAAATASSLGWIPRSIRSASTSLWTCASAAAPWKCRSRANPSTPSFAATPFTTWLAGLCPKPAPMFARHSRNLSGSSNRQAICSLPRCVLAPSPGWRKELSGIWPGKFCAASWTSSSGPDVNWPRWSMTSPPGVS